MTVRPLLPQRRALITLQCDRCGHDVDISWLTFDGLGLVCPACRVGGALARGEVMG